jgi:hypothetical protein
MQKSERNYYYEITTEAKSNIKGAITYKKYLIIDI